MGETVTINWLRSVDALHWWMHSIDESELRCWLELYRELLNQITEMAHVDNEQQEGTLDESVGNGILIVKQNL